MNQTSNQSPNPDEPDPNGLPFVDPEEKTMKMTIELVDVTEAEMTALSRFLLRQDAQNFSEMSDSEQECKDMSWIVRKLSWTLQLMGYASWE